MTRDREIGLKIRIAFDSDDLDEFLRLLSEHPEWLRKEDGTDDWMWRAALEGRIDFMEVLVDLGMDVNESKDKHSPERELNPFYQAEGPILQAAGSGHLEVVRWLLERGAKINYVVQGKPRCLPLVRAATIGDLKIVKVLVEYGADIHATWRGINAITEAEDYGQFAVRDYLHSLGARTLREMTPPDYPTAHKTFINQMIEESGALGSWRLEIPGDPNVTLHLIPASDLSDVQTLFTVGLSDHSLPQGRKSHSCTELLCMLPRDWPLTDAALHDPNWNWPVEWLKRLVAQLRDADRWPEPPVIFMNGDPPMALAPNTELCGWLCLKVLGKSVKSPDHRWIDIHTLFPIYLEELALIREIGQDEFANLCQEREVPLYVDPQRPKLTVT